MSILIKGMEMPKSCGECPLICFTTWGGDAPYKDEVATICLATADRKYVFHSNEERDINCPLIEVPKHGRLIDEQWLKDAMITTLKALKKNPKMDRQEMHLIAAFDALRLMVEDAPTIIESESDNES